MSNLNKLLDLLPYSKKDVRLCISEIRKSKFNWWSKEELPQLSDKDIIDAILNILEGSTLYTVQIDEFEYLRALIESPLPIYVLSVNITTESGSQVMNVLFRSKLDIDAVRKILQKKYLRVVIETLDYA